MKATQWIPVLLPKEVVEQLIKSYIAPSKDGSYLKILKDLQTKVKKVKYLKELEKLQIIKKLHKARKGLLKENPHAYIDYTA